LELGDSNALLFYGKHWSQDKRIAYRTINARRETVDPAPSFRQAFKLSSGKDASFPLMANLETRLLAQRLRRHLLPPLQTP